MPGISCFHLFFLTKYRGSELQQHPSFMASALAQNNTFHCKLAIVDGRNSAPVDKANVPLLTEFYTSQVVVWDFFYQHYEGWFQDVDCAFKKSLVPCTSFKTGSRDPPYPTWGSALVRDMLVPRRVSGITSIPMSPSLSFIISEWILAMVHGQQGTTHM